jgi:uncharacterized membrane protein
MVTILLLLLLPQQLLQQLLLQLQLLLHFLLQLLLLLLLQLLLLLLPSTTHNIGYFCDASTLIVHALRIAASSPSLRLSDRTHRTLSRSVNGGSLSVYHCGSRIAYHRKKNHAESQAQPVPKSSQC